MLNGLNGAMVLYISLQIFGIFTKRLNSISVKKIK